MGWNCISRYPIGIATRVAAVAVAIVLTAPGCGGSGESTLSGESSSSVDGGGTVASSDSGRGAGEAASTPQCRKVAEPKQSGATYEAPEQTVGRDAALTAIVRTSCGTFSIALDAKRFPTTVNSFVYLARKGFYDGTSFNQAGAGKYLRGGDPPGDAAGPGYTVKGNVPKFFVYKHRTVAMWHPLGTPRGSSGSQFFIIVAKPWLDFSWIYAPLGVIKGGLEVVDGISRFGPGVEGPSNLGVTGPIGKLRRTVLIESISIRREA